jgi:hypothetical protein
MTVRGLGGAAGAFAVFAFAPAAATATAPPLPAAVGRVTVLQSSSASPRARRCLRRLREELTAGGFEVTVNEFGAGGEALWMVEPPSPRDGSIATLTLVGNPDEANAELWIVDGVPGGRVVVRRLLIPAGAETHEDEVLAVRTLEFLRASAFELAGRAPAAPATPAAPSGPAPSTPPVTVASKPPPPPVASLAPPPTGPVSFELGLGLIESSRALGPAFLPVARLRAEWLSLLETRVTVAGFGTQAEVTTPRGTATVGQMVGLVDLRMAFRHGHDLRPAIGVGGGVLRVNVEGAGTEPYQGLHGLRWVGLLDVGAGFTARLFRRLSVALEAHGQLAAPYPTVRFSGEDVARIGRPALFSSLTLVTPL